MRRSLRLAVPIAALLIALGAATAPAAAQPEKDPAGADAKAKKAAKKLLASGDRKFARGKYDDALADYQAAFDAYPDSRIYFAIARAEERLGLHMDSLRHYTQLLEEAQGLDGNLRDSAKAALKDIKKHLAALKLTIKPEGATITVDGNEIGTAPLVEPHWMEPGKHTFTIRADGYTPHDATVDLGKGDVLEEEIVLEPVPGVVPPKPPSGEVSDGGDAIDAPGPSKLPLWIGLGATGTLAAASIVTGVLAVSRYGTYTDDTANLDDRESARSTGRKLSIATDVLFLATLASGAFTAYYYYGVYRPKLRELEGDQAVWLAPQMDDEQVGLAVGGRF